ncbi:MAG: hypothetical protein ABIE36_00780 [Candidatus Diapherotrites archaeon]
MITKMNTKKLMVSICTIAIALFLVVTVSASNTMTSDAPTIEVDGINLVDNPSVIAGETVAVKVMFTALEDASNVRIKVSIEGDKADVNTVTTNFDVEAGYTYKKTLSIEVPFELKDMLSDDVTLTVRIWNGDNEYEEDFSLQVQRPSYNPVVKSVSTSQSVNAGETFPVDVVLKNLGYNDLEDVYVIVGIPALGIERTSYFGDLVTLETCTSGCDEKEKDTVSGRIFLEVPYTAEAGVYTLEVKVTNDDVTSKFARQIVIENELSENVIVMTSGKRVALGENAEYSLLLVNPTNSLKVYQIVAESSGDLSSNVDSTFVAVSAGSSKTVTITASAKTEGDYNFKVNVLSGEKLVSQVALNLKVEGKSVNPIVVLTVVLAIIFLVLLVVLIVLIGKKPQKTEEFGESYY